MRRLHHMSICSEGMYYLVVMAFILTAAILRQINLLMILYGVLAGPLLLSWRLVRRQVKQVDVSRHAPTTVTAGEPFRVELAVSNGRTRGGSFALAVRDELQRRGRGADRSVAAEVYCRYVPAGEERRVTYQGLLNRRGLYDFQPLKLSSRFPLGLLRTMVRIEKPQRLTVLPRIGRLSPSWKRLLRAEDHAATGATRQNGFHDGDFYGLRDWRPGDPSTRIHWRTSARRQTLTVRQYERRRHAGLLLIVDLWEPPKAGEELIARTESVVSLAATVLVEACRLGGGGAIQLELAAKRSRRLQGSASPPWLHNALQLLAAVEPTPGDDALIEVLARTLAEQRPNVNIVLLSTRPLDLFDRRRFAEVWNRLDLHDWPARLVQLAPTDSRWSEIFSEATP